MAKKSFIHGAMILMVAGFIVRILGFIFRIFLSNLIGAEGMGLFQLIFPFYVLIVMTLTSGISLAVSKMVASEIAIGHIINSRRITYCATALVMCLAMLVSATIWFNADFISNVLLKDSRTYLSILLLIPCIPFIACAAALKGYFYGMQEVVPTAISQIVEQVVRIGFVCLLASTFLKVSLSYACAVAIIGIALGEIANTLVLFLVYRFGKSRKKKYSKEGCRRKRDILLEMISITAPVSLNRLIVSILGTMEVVLIPRRLLAGGMNYQNSIEEYGRLTGMAMPLLSFPSLVTSSIAVTLVPAISESLSLKRFNTANSRITKSIQISFILGFVFTALFITFPSEIGDVIYAKQKVGDILFVLAFTSIPMYLQQTLLGILNGLGKQGIALRNSILGSVIRIFFVYFVVPIYAINGYVCGVIISAVLMCALNMYSVIKTTGMAIDLRNWIIKPGFVGICMLVFGKMIYNGIAFFCLGPIYTIIITIVVYLMVSLLLLIALDALKLSEIRSMMGLKEKAESR